MKKIRSTIILLFFSLGFIACFEDDNNYNYAVLEDVLIEGIEEEYTKISHQDMLSITPTVTTTADVEYAWELWTSIRKDGTIYKPDTLAQTKDLNYEITETPGTYYLIFNVKNKLTGVTTMFQSTLKIETINSTGWFLLKDEGVTEKHTDYDFFYNGGRIDNWIAFYNDGRQLKGSAVKSVFTPNYSKSSEANEINNYLSMLVPVSSEDICLIELNSGVIERDCESLFFSEPVKNFQNIDVTNSNFEMYLVNDGRFYHMSPLGGGSFYEVSGSYNIAPYRFNGLMNSIFFDEASQSFMYANSTSIAPYIESTDAPISSNAMNADLLWGSSVNFKNQSTGWYSYCLLQQHGPAETYLLAKISGAYNYNNSNPIKEVDNLPATLNLVSAERWAVNADYGIIYFVKDHQLWKYLIDSQYEEAILDLPVGEEITYMRHIAFPNPLSNMYSSEVNCFAIATYADGRYKVWLHEFDGDNLKPLDTPTFEGNGRVACVTYVKDNTSNFPY